MSKVCLSSGQQSLSRLKYAALSLLVPPKAAGGTFLDMLVSAVGFMEGFDADGLCTSPRFDEESSNLTSSLLLVPYHAPPKEVSKSKVQNKIRVIHTIKPKEDEVSTYERVFFSTNSESIFDDLHLLSDVNPSSLKTRVCKREEKNVSKDESKGIADAAQIPPLSISEKPGKTKISSVISNVLKDYVVQSPFSTEELCYNILNSTNSPDVTLDVLGAFLAAGVTIPREIMLNHLDRLSEQSKEVAYAMAVLMNPELRLPYGRFCPDKKQMAKIVPNFFELQNLERRKMISCDISQLENDVCKQVSKLSRLQRVRNKR